MLSNLKSQRRSQPGEDRAACTVTLRSPTAACVAHVCVCIKRQLSKSVKGDCCTVAGEAPCIATYWVTRYWQLLLLRLLTGLSLGGILPLVLSLLGDLFSVRRVRVWARARARARSGLAIARNPKSTL